MLIDSVKERLLTRYGFLYDALDAVRAGKRFSEDEKAALRDRYASVSQVVLAERADGYTAELLGSAMLLLNALSPHRPLAVAEAIEKLTPIPKVKLRYGIEAASLQFTEPARARWSKQNCEFLVGYQTGLLAPFDRIFVKRVVGTPVSGHDLLMKLTGRALPFSPTFLGYVESKPGSHVYFFENLAPGFATLESELNSSAIICLRIITDIVCKAASLFRTIYRFGFVYTDFCAKNIMIERKTQELAIIDIDSCVPMEVLLKPERLKAGGQEEFWGLWNQHLSKSRPLRVENAQKSVVFRLLLSGVVLLP